MRTLRCLVIGLAVLGSEGSAQVTAGDSVELLRITRTLVDAITAGDTVAWAARLAPNWFMTDEEGNVATRGEFLRGLKPLPMGQSGNLTVVNPRLTGGGAVAVVTYDIDEYHNYYGQILLTRFHSTDTYVRTDGRWRQQASQMTALPRRVDGKAVAYTLARDYAGTYALNADIRLTIAASDSGLRIVREGRPAQPLHALDDRTFVRHGVRGYWVFERDATGSIARLVNWRDNNAVVWTRQR